MRLHSHTVRPYQSGARSSAVALPKVVVVSVHRDSFAVVAAAANPYY